MTETAAESIPPLVVEVEVGVDVARAFDAWVSRLDLWWPPGHSLTGDPQSIVVEPRVGGRIFERTRSGDELPWGEVLAWDPPTSVRWLWHLGFVRSEATEVEVTFAPSPDGTVVRLVQTGWDRLGEAGAPRRSRTIAGWTEVAAAFRRRLDLVHDDLEGAP